jgi:hypothetical protein
MKQVVISKPKTGRQGRLIIDIVLKSPSESYHLGRVTYSGRGLYAVAQTHQCLDSPIDTHISYHPNGEMHGKLTRGKLFKWPPGQFLGQAKPHTKDEGILLWQRKGQIWNSLKGIEKFAQHPNGIQTFVNTEALRTLYPIYKNGGADYVFEIEVQFPTPKLIDIEYFLVEVGNKQSLEDEIDEIVGSQPGYVELFTVEKAVLFTNLSPWFAIVVFAKRNRCPPLHN